jgi:nucleoside 2-deoxyribosyltransferase
MPQSAAESVVARIEPKIELAVLGFLVSLILKGTLDTIFGRSLVEAADWIEVWRIVGQSNPLELGVFLFALVRFMYGAYRFHEELPRPSALLRSWNILFTVLLFIAFYFDGLTIKQHPVLFYQLFGAVHVVDLLWFISILVSMIRRDGLLRARDQSLAEAAAMKFVVLDVVTIGAVLLGLAWAGVLAGGRPASYELTPLGLWLLALGGADVWWNHKFYFARPPEKRPAAPREPSMPIQGARRVYFAAPLFTQNEWTWNAALAARLRALGYEVLLPQESAWPMLSGAVRFDAQMLFEQNLVGIERSEALVAILDGADADSGTCFECGYARKAGRPVIGVRTDLRRSGDDPEAGVNLMLSRSCAKLITLPYDRRDDATWVAGEIAAALRAIAPTLAESNEDDSTRPHGGPRDPDVVGGP